MGFEYYFFSELMPAHRAYIYSRHSCSSACCSCLLWTGQVLGDLWRCLLTRRMGLCSIGAFSRALAWGGGRVDERAGTGAGILACRHCTLFYSRPSHLLHLLVRCPSLGLHSHLCTEPMPCCCYTMALLLPIAYFLYSTPSPICNKRN